MAFVENGNGLFSNNRDYFYFYAQGPSGWADTYDASEPDTAYLDHPYESRNFYYLTVATGALPMPGAPLRIAARSGALGDTTGATVPATFPARLHLEQDDEYLPDATPIQGVTGGIYRRSTLFWEKWFWTSLNRGQGFNAPLEPPGIDPTQPADRKSTRLNSSHIQKSRMPSSA